MPSRFRLARIAEFAHTDMAGIVHYSRYFNYMEEAEHAFFRSLGLPAVPPVDGRTIIWPRVKVSFEYRRPLRFQDAFEVRLVVERIGRSSITYRGEIVKDGEIMAVGRSTCACCEMDDAGAMKPVAIPKRFMDQIDAEEGES
jgi:4-hydroxybenzoyl-CoA thioesterase/acyl-CoA thioester hydrolase